MADAVQQIVLEYIAKTDKLDAQLKDMQKDMSGFDDKAKQTSSTFTNLKGQLSGIATGVAAAFSVAKVQAFLKESISLALAAQDIKAGFEALNDPLLLGKLKTAVKGTVDEVTLMKKALEARNLGIPLQNLAKIFEFAKLRADQTGKSVESLIDSMVNGIGVQSKRALVQVGISQTQFNNQVLKSGDYFSALSSIIDTELEKAGKQIEDTGDRTEQLKVRIVELRTEIGENLLPVQELWLKSLNGLATIMSTGALSMFGNFANVQKQINENFDKGLDLITPFVHFVEDSGTKFKTITDALKDYNAEAVAYVEKVQSQGVANEQAAALLDPLYSKYLRQIKVLSLYAKSHEENNKTIPPAIIKERVEIIKLIGTFETTNPLIEDFAENWIKVTEALKHPEDIFNMKTAVEGLAKSILAIQAIADEGVIGIKTSDLWASSDIMAEIQEIDKQNFADAEQFKRDQAAETMNFILGIQDTISAYHKAQVDYQLSLLEDRNERGLLSDARYAEEKKKLLQQEADRDKRNAIFEAVIQSALNIINAIGTLNPLIVTLTTIASFAELATIIATPIPKFAGGIERVKGKHKGKDSVLSLLMPDEAVITAKENMKNPGLAKAWNAGKLDDYILRVYAPKLMSKVENKSSNVDITPLMRMMHEDIQVSKENTRKIVKALNSNYNPYRNWN